MTSGRCAKKNFANSRVNSENRQDKPVLRSKNLHKIEKNAVIVHDHTQKCKMQRFLVFTCLFNAPKKHNARYFNEVFYECNIHRSN